MPAVVRHIIAEAVDGLEANPVVRAQGTGVSLRDGGEHQFKIALAYGSEVLVHAIEGTHAPVWFVHAHLAHHEPRHFVFKGAPLPM